MNKYLSTKNISSIAILAALAGVLMFFDFPIVFVAPDFYKVDLSNVPCLIASFSMGAIPGFLTVILKIIVKLALKGTNTMLVGELADFVTSGVYCVVGAIYYKRNRTKKGAYKALLIASVCTVLLSSLANYLFIIPAYVSLLHFPLDAIISAGNKIFSFVTSKESFVLACVLLFNIIKVILNDILTILLYKRISPLLK